MLPRSLGCLRDAVARESSAGTLLEMWYDLSESESERLKRSKRDSGVAEKRLVINGHQNRSLFGRQDEQACICSSQIQNNRVQGRLLLLLTAHCSAPILHIVVMGEVNLSLPPRSAPPWIPSGGISVSRTRRSCLGP